MPLPRCEPESNSPRVSLHIGPSPEAAWEHVVRPWFEKVCSHSLRESQPAAVVTASRSQAYLFRNRLLACGTSLLGIKFLSTPQLRENLLRNSKLHIPLREHLRLLLAVTAEEFAAELERSNNEEALPIAQSIARDPDHFLRALDQLGGAGWRFEEIDSPALQEIAARFDKRARDCGFTFVYEADRAALQDAEKLPSLFSNLLLFGFDAAHWPLWPLLHAATLSSKEATIVLNDPRDEARDLDETWVETWQQAFGAAEPIPASDAASTSAFAQLLEQPLRGSKRKARASAHGDNVHFFMGRDTTEQAHAIAALTVAFLNKPSFDQLAILLPGAGALARFAASWLERLHIPHNDAIAHQMRGTFDDEEWRAWIELQRQPRLGPLVRFLKQSPAAVAMFEPLPLPKIEETLQRACGDILINAVDVLREYCSRRTEDGKYIAVAAGLNALSFLPQRATFHDLLKRTLSIFPALKWRERAAELERLSRDLSESFTGEISRENFVRWLSEIFTESSLAHDERGDHPYSRVHLLRYDQAYGATWSHVIFAGLNEGVWPPRDNESPFLPDDVIAALNERNKQASRFGEGPRVARGGKTLCLGARERRALAIRQLLNVIESTTQSIGITADLYTYAPREQPINPSEFYAQLFFRARREALSQRQISQLHKQTQRWLAQWEFLRDGEESIVDLAQTERAYRVRRNDAPFGEYEFAFRTNAPPAEQAELSATNLANALKRPALVWMKHFLGVDADEIGEGSWNLATGQWVHRWLAVIGAEARENRFVPRLPDEQLVGRVVTAADDFRDLILSILADCGRSLPDWWRSGWRNARHLAEQFAKQVAATADWPLVATEWKLDSPEIIGLGNGEELRVRGRVDLILARDDSQLWIIDYKTGEAKPLSSKSTDLRKQLISGDGIQICIYLLALRERSSQILASLLTRGANLAAQVSLDDVTAHDQVWNELARMEKTGIFGMLGELRSEFSFTGTYPLATLGIDKDLLRQKWERTHPAFKKQGEK